ncbi:MAG: FkbM family methyltransferase [Ignisphaera sp.]
MGSGIKKVIKSMRQFLIYLLKVRGTTLKDELRLIIAIIMYLVMLGRRGSTLGFYIPGRKFLTIRTWDGCIFKVRPKTTDLGFATLTSEFYELTKWFIPNAKGVVIDVGANIGGYTVRACRQAELVIAIEPQKEIFELLKVNVENNCTKHNVILIRKAIGDRKEKALLKIPVNKQVVDSGRASLSKSNLVLDIESPQIYRYEEVEVDTLDDIVGSLGINGVDFIKIDIEGAEATAFKGMKYTLQKAKYLMIEIQPGNEWLIEELKEMGFKLIDRRDMNYFFVK